MGIRTFQIQLTNNPYGVYVAGQWIQGNVILDLNKETKARGVTLKFVGAANVHWTETHSTGSGKNRRTHTRHYNNHETYFNQQVYLWGNGNSDGPPHPAGQMVYPFQFQLPANLPSSFEGRVGNVRYFMECRVDRPWKFDHKAKLPFTVNAVLDLNQYPQAREPRHGMQSKTLCCWCCKSGPITNSLTLERGGYVPGEFIMVNGEVDNKSSRAMNSSSIIMKQVTTFRATSKCKVTTNTVATYKRGEIEAGESELWSGQMVHIPPLPPSDLIYCNIIDIKYYIVLVADPSGPAFDLEAPCEVTIGTVPLYNIQHLYANTPPPPPLPPPGMATAADPGAAFAIPALPPSAPPAADFTNEAPPPSYEQCVLGQVSIRDDDDQYTHGTLDYAPQYTYYTWNK